MRVERPTRTAVSLATVVVVGLLVVSAVGGALSMTLHDPTIGVAAGQSQPANGTEIDSCRTISSSGRYVLTEDVRNATVDTCLRITASDVTLDGRGNLVDGIGDFGTTGVRVEGGSNVTVRNVEATDWDDGVRFVGTRRAVAANTTTARNRVGLSLVSLRDSRAVNNVARSNAVAGVFLVGSSSNNTLRNTTASENALVGVQLVEATGTTVVGTEVRGNEFGVALLGANGNVVRDSVASGNHIAGLWLSAASDNRIRENRVSNRFYGVYLADGAENNTVESNDAVNNSVGVRLRASDRNAILRNRVTDSSDTGILLISSDDNRVVGNRGAENRRGIVVSKSSSGNVRSNNSVGEA
ncbi:periplasmic copper-binding protein [Haladaptatus paucihalophilus DX253]|uniref:Parallel beta-helix repeat (Two copies) n=1 Tax=Haladaptatus paucihalophilus DX253 TaxID=797209 RepID=E7QZS9_HALPU|nr:right-handed parallel beta-helix repeat-containing protein [Haladaptatus paucihalophilus]EFW89823.1 periplasmic copper-binding protein [Haladaptatus paucihalophilus DX253]SHK55310.1 parallel beta-helix repeat (two copies) [Haladaptatus paucihalophilus DX253]